MEQDVISKKELLELTGISYGQLYRWKRERLLPEEWFIKRSSYTGQETFFPRAQTLERIRFIKELKGDLSLDAIADLISPQSGNEITIDDLSEILDVDSEYLALVVDRLKKPHQKKASNKENPNDQNTLAFGEAVFIGALGALATVRVISPFIAAELVFDGFDLVEQWRLATMGCVVLAVSEDKGSNSIISWHLALYKEGSSPLFSRRITVAAQLPLEASSAAIKRALKERDAIQNAKTTKDID